VLFISSLADTAVLICQQDLSYLTADRYAALMRHWLSTAAPLSQILQDKGTNLKDYCNITQPPHSDPTDLYLTYKNNEDFERLGKDLAPMLFSVSGGVSKQRPGSEAACRCSSDGWLMQAS